MITLIERGEEWVTFNEKFTIKFFIKYKKKNWKKEFDEQEFKP
jgi:hypothetical protein